MLQLLDSLQVNTSIDLHREHGQGHYAGDHQVAARVMPHRILRSMIMTARWSTCPTSTGEYVYLNFCNSFSYYCIKEYEYLKILQQRLQGQVKIVTIL